MPPKRAPHITVSVPIERPEHIGYVQRHVDIQLTEDQGKALKAIRLALNERNVRLRSGRVVHSSADTIRYLLEAIDSELSSGNGSQKNTIHPKN